VDATWTYTQAEDADTGERLLRRPQNTVSIDARATPIPNLTIAPELTYTGRFQDYLIEDSGNSDGIGSSKPGTIVNVAVTYQVHPQVQVFAKGSNIFDSKFEPANGYLTPGASFLAGVRARY
jgi:vitamin B12 transporter